MANPSRAVVSSVAYSRFLTQGEAFFMKLDYSNIGMMKYYVLTARYALACFLTESVKWVHSDYTQFSAQDFIYTVNRKIQIKKYVPQHYLYYRCMIGKLSIGKKKSDEKQVPWKFCSITTLIKRQSQEPFVGNKRARPRQNAVVLLHIFKVRWYLSRLCFRNRGNC